MMISILRLICRSFYPIVACILTLNVAFAKTPVEIRDKVDQHIFTFNEIEVLEDPSGMLSLKQIQQGAYSQKFKLSITSTPQTLNLNASYWFKIRIKNNAAVKKHFVLEFKR